MGTVGGVKAHRIQINIMHETFVVTRKTPIYTKNGETTKNIQPLAFVFLNPAANKFRR